MYIEIGAYLADVERTASELTQRNIVRRLWRQDHTVWKPGPTEIENRLGWLTATDLMRKQVSALASFVQEVRQADFRHVVLLGMGGSSLGAETICRSFGSAKGLPEFIVLDSTLPACIQAVTENIDPVRTLFLVSSKSGTTAESICLFEYFLSLVQSTAGKAKAGQNFTAITDSETPLARRAEAEQFRRVFLNPANIGGRYSVLSYFGLVPAALMGIDLAALLERADQMRNLCAISTSVQENPGAWLGTVIGVLAQKGRDKLTLMISPTISSFGLWMEQLIAESTGKDDKGIIPVVGEPLAPIDCYGDDRLFIYLRLRNDRNSPTDEIIKKLKSAGQPVVVLEMQDGYDLGAEFFRWEFATAVAGAILGVNPFAQPHVEAAKQATERVLQEYVTTGHLPQSEVYQSLADLIPKIKQGMYLAFLAYLMPTMETDKALRQLRRKYLVKYHIATTLGYGPRYLHSTGQLYKGGPATGLFLQLTTNHEKDLPIPCRPYTFSTLVDAQALGDFQALRSLGRQVIGIHLRQGDEADISRLDWS